MPAKNRLKIYSEGSYYHIYNRGVEKRLIFLDEQDYTVFLSYLKEYLLPKDTQALLKILSNPLTPSFERDKALKLLRLNNFYNELTLLAYCLMPNHYHFLIKQNSNRTIDMFTNSLCTRYTMYFNKKYKRVGALYQGVYKAVLITTDEQLLELSRYIHKQALPTVSSQSFQPSSYPEYLGQRKTPWVKPEGILAFFSQTNPALSYKAFVEQKNDFEEVQRLTNLTLESD